MPLILTQGLFIISVYGYRLSLEKFLKYKSTSVWFISLLILNVFAYIGLILGNLNNALGLFMFIGLALFLLSFDYIKKIRIRLPHIIIGVILALFVNSLSLVNLVHYDNFSHWAKIIRFISETMRLPGASDTIIEFTSYPPGSALIPAVVTKLFVFNESTMLISQFMLIAASILAMFSDVKDKNRMQPQLILFLSIGITFVSAKSIGFDTLLVDALMVYMGLGLYATISGHRDNFKAMTLSVIVGIFSIILVKNSAIYFAIPSLLHYLYLSFKYHRYPRKIIMVILVLPLSFLSLPSWNNHVNGTFAQVSKHSVDAHAYTKILSSKTEAIRSQISNSFIDTTLSIESPATLMIVFAFIALLVFAILRYRKYPKTLKQTSWYVILLLSYVITYFIGIYIMFMISMPTEEALVLAGYDRYAMSMGIYVVVLTGFNIMHWLDELYFASDLHMRSLTSFKSIKSKKIYQLSTLVLSLIVIMLFMAESNRIVIQNRFLTSNLPKEFTSVMPPSPLKDSSYLIVSSNDDNRIESYYLHVVSEYYLWTDRIIIKDEFYKFSDSEFIELLKSVDTILVISYNVSFNEKLYDLVGIHLQNGYYSSEEILKLIN